MSRCSECARGACEDCRRLGYGCECCGKHVNQPTDEGDQ